MIFTGFYAMNLTIGFISENNAEELVRKNYQIQLEDGLSKILNHLYVLNADQRVIRMRYGSGSVIKPDIIFSMINKTTIIEEISSFQTKYTSFIDQQKKKFQGTSTFDQLKSLLENNICNRLPDPTKNLDQDTRLLFEKLKDQCVNIHSGSLVKGNYIIIQVFYPRSPLL